MITQAITGLQDVFSKNIFPRMKVRWNAYPNNIGHLEFDGCFRCHNDRHASKEGDRITRDCQICHSIIAQGSPDEMAYARIGQSLEFKHPADVGDDWKEVNEPSGYGVESDKFNKVSFSPVKTDAVRIEPKISEGGRCGVHEWRIENDADKRFRPENQEEG